MTSQPVSTVPKPFVFVLMPFDKEFKDIYEFGIKGAAQDVGAYAERLDEQIFVEGMLERIFNQISKADVIVADMTGRNPNVFYEVGYAHALGKIVLLLTKDAEDIPFDLKHRQHTVHKGSITNLRQDLAEKLKWAINQAKQQSLGTSEAMSLSILGTQIPRWTPELESPVIQGMVKDEAFFLQFILRNDSYASLLTLTHVYLFCKKDSSIVPSRHSWQGITTGGNLMGNVAWVPNLLVNTTATMGATGIPTSSSEIQPLESFPANSIDAPDGLSQQFRLNLSFQGIPPGAPEVAQFGLMFKKVDQYEGPFRLRFHSISQFHDFSFRLHLKIESKSEHRSKAGHRKEKGTSSPE